MYKPRINFLIQRAGIKKKFIAESIGVSANQLSNWISGKNYPTVDKAFKLADLLNCDVKDLYEWKN
ncbi:helix-turn-helix domain-containing protein [Priestia koreensis]|uniref:helix-turn-helix domain-containing protein n=1 Tax=Priestia koreensis TaxID=284581 RepID=UPI003CFD3A85